MNSSLWGPFTVKVYKEKPSKKLYLVDENVTLPMGGTTKTCRAILSFLGKQFSVPVDQITVRKSHPQESNPETPTGRESVWMLVEINGEAYCVHAETAHDILEVAKKQLAQGL